MDVEFFPHTGSDFASPNLHMNFKCHRRLLQYIDFKADALQTPVRTLCMYCININIRYQYETRSGIDGITKQRRALHGK